MPKSMIIQYLSPLTTEFHTESASGGRRWTLHEPFLFAVNGEKFEVPVGFWTDFASIPRSVWPIINPYEIGKGPIPHDFGYYTGAKTREYWDEVLWNCMVLEKFPVWKQTAVFKAVRLFGGLTWRRYRKTNTKHYVFRTLDRNVFQIRNWRGKS